MNYSIKDFFSKCDQIHNTHAEVLLCKATLLKSHFVMVVADLVTFTEEILNGKLELKRDDDLKIKTFV